MKVIALFLVVTAVFAADFRWGFNSIQLIGPRDEVISFSKDLARLYETDSGERLINYFRDHNNIMRIDNHFEDEAEVFKNLLERAKKEIEIPKEISVERYLVESEKVAPSLEAFSSYPFITVKGSDEHREIILDYLREIEETELGKKLYEDMKSCGYTLLINDDKHSVGGGGYTSATHPGERIFNGTGSNSKIRFRFDQPEEGSHLVQDVKGGTIPFSYITNLYHELVHAKHLMCGTMSKFYSEHQAIEEENAFRKSLPDSSHLPARDPSRYEEGCQVWFGLSL